MPTDKTYPQSSKFDTLRLAAADKCWLEEQKKEVSPSRLSRPRVNGKRIHLVSIDEPFSDGRTLKEVDDLYNRDGESRSTSYTQGAKRTKRLSVIDRDWPDGLDYGEYQLFKDLRADEQAQLEESLTKREKEVAELKREGMSQAEIARKLDISRAAVTKHIKKIDKKTSGLWSNDLIDFSDGRRKWKRRELREPGILQTQKLSLEPKRVKKSRAA